MTPEQDRASFEAWASVKGYDTAHTYDTERSRWVFFNPMTADLWKAWKAGRAQMAQQREPLTQDQIDALKGTPQ